MGVYYGRTKGTIALVNDSRGSFYISLWDDVLGMDSQAEAACCESLKASILCWL